MKTFHGNPELKESLLKELKMHQDLDAFIQGAWLDTDSGKVEGNGFKGCFYGCTMQTSTEPIEKFSEKYNIDLWYCYLTEIIFEGLPKKESKRFPLESIKIIPIGANFSEIKSLFYYRLLDGQLRFCKGNKKITNAVLKCMELFKTPFIDISESAARSAWSAARSAAESAAESAESAWSAAESAWSAAESAESAARSARSAAWSAWSAWSAARSAESAESNYYIFLRNLLFDCVKQLNK